MRTVVEQLLGKTTLAILAWIIATVLVVLWITSWSDAAGAATCSSKAGGEGWKYLVSRSTGSHCWYNPKEGRPQIDSFRLAGSRKFRKIAIRKLPVPHVRPIPQVDEPEAPVTTAVATPGVEPPTTPNYIPNWLDDFDTIYKRPFDVATLTNWPVQPVTTLTVAPPPVKSVESLRLNPERVKIASFMALFGMVVYSLFPLLSKAGTYLHDGLIILLGSTRLQQDMKAIEDLSERPPSVESGWILK